MAVAGLGLGGAALAGCSSDNVVSGLTVSRKDQLSRLLEPLRRRRRDPDGGDGGRLQESPPRDRPLRGHSRLGNPYYTKLSLATLGDKPPNVAVSHLTRAKTLIAADLLEELTALTRWRRSASRPTSSDQRAWDAGLVDGKSYAVPLDTHPIVTFYNTDICEKAGLLDSDGKLTPFTSEQTRSSTR